MQGSTEGSETEWPDSNKANNKSPCGVLLPKLRVIPWWELLSLERGSRSKFWSNPVQMQAGSPRYDTGTVAIPSHRIIFFLVPGTYNINLFPYLKFMAKDKTKSESVLTLPLSSKPNSDTACTNPQSSKESYTLLTGSAGTHFRGVFCLSNCCHTLKSLQVVKVHPLRTLNFNTKQVSTT